MVKNIFVCIVIAIVIASCGKMVDMDSLSVEETEIETKLSIISTPFYMAYTDHMDSITAPEIWNSFESYDEMKKACQIPEKMIKLMSTKEIALSCINYPLNSVYIAYNDKGKGVEAIIDSFNGYSELFSRNDAVKYLLDLYENFAYSGTTQEEELNINSKEQFPIITLNFLEYLLNSKYIEEKYTIAERKRVADIATDIYVSKRKDEKSYGYHSLSLSERLVTNVVDNNYVTQSDDIVCVRTRGGQIVYGFFKEEDPIKERRERNKAYMKIFPNAIILDSSTTTYNCHSYAWNIADGGDDICWINASHLGNDENFDNLSPYWTNDYYWETPSFDYAQKILCYDDDYGNDHSLIPSTSVSGKFESKWANGPLMLHSLEYMPFPTDNMRFFTHLVMRGVLLCSNGYGATNVGTFDTYSVPSGVTTMSDMVSVWEIYDAKGDNAIENGKAIISSLNDNYIVVKFNAVGVYSIVQKAYRRLDNILFREYSYEVYVEE